MANSAIIVALLVLFSTFGYWHGAYAYSYRYMVDVLPCLVLGMAAAWPWIEARRLRAGLSVAAAIFSVAVQVVGAFFYPCGWPDTPASIYVKPDRFWDWKDSEFTRCLASGPVVPDGIKFMRSLSQGNGSALPQP